MPAQQRNHEDYWGRCWAVALGRHLNAQVQSSRPAQDPPDVDFAVRWSDGTKTTTWGEMTGAYNDSNEARWLWGGAPGTQQGDVYCEPDAVVALEARALVEQKRQKYSALAQQRGLGHLLVLLHSPLTMRSGRVEAERSIRDLLTSLPLGSANPFETVWLGYRLPFTMASQREDSQYVFRDRAGGGRLNFLKCVWAT